MIIPDYLILVALFVFVVFLIILVQSAYRRGQKTGEYKKETEWQEKLTKLRREIADKQRAGIKGKISEIFAPYLPNFPFKSSECKFIGDPVDYIVFEGLDEEDIKQIHFVEIKTDKSKLTNKEKRIKDIIDSGKIKWFLYRFNTESETKS
ncbi:MAG: Holliday junction resolvase [Candidatus Aenigmatarchaeota archaeon]|nr:MAG: Holliday junction resolvase [Candidatus Aenigmarchaeota archaeon]